MTLRKPSFLEEVEQLGTPFEQEGEKFLVFKQADWIVARSKIEQKLKSQGRELIEFKKANKRLSNILKRKERQGGEHE